MLTETHVNSASAGLPCWRSGGYCPYLTGIAKVTRLIPLAYKGHILARNEFDASNKDDGISITSWPALGIYKPDKIAAYTAAHVRICLLSANEGDTRSPTIWDTQGRVVYDSGSQIARLLAEQSPTTINSDGLADSFDCRSDDIGADPEAVTVGSIGGSTYAFLGLVSGTHYRLPYYCSIAFSYLTEYLQSRVRGTCRTCPRAVFSRLLLKSKLIQ